MNSDQDQIDLAKAMCSVLTDYKPDEERCRGRFCKIVHKSGDGRSLYINRKGDKHQVSCEWPRYDGSYYQPSDADISTPTTIGVSVSRGPEALAKDIQRRLVPMYDVQYPHQVERMRKQINHDNSEFEIRNHIVVDMLGSSVSQMESKRVQGVRVYRHGVYQISVSGERVKLELDYLPKELAMEIVEMLKQKVPEKS